MKRNKRLANITLVSASVLLGLITATGYSNAKADTTNDGIETVDQQEQNFDSSEDYNSSDTDEVSLNKKVKKVLENTDIDENSLSQYEISELNKINFEKVGPKNATQFTYHQYRNVGKKMIARDKQYRIPYFNAKKIKNMPATRTRDAQTGKVANLEVWDSWAVRDPKTGLTANYKGYQLAVSMMGIPNGNGDAHIYLLYNKFNDNNINHWKTAGPIFGFHANNVHQEWSGSAILNKDNTVQLFYTDVDTTDGFNHQTISTANLTLKIDKKGKLSISKVKNRHELFDGDGYHYQTYDQWKSTNKGADNICMRDAHVITDHGQRYLVFEASTGLENYQGEDQIYNWQNYGGTDESAIKEFLGIVNNPDMKSRASWGNAALGILKLDDDENNPTVEEIYTPLITSPMVSDEIERPNLIKLNGKYYLFAITRLNRGTGDDIWKKANIEIGDNVGMLGWVSDHLTYGYKPLNGDATVLTASVPFNWRTSTYAYYPMPIKGKDDEILVPSYMTNRGYAAGPGKRSTWAPSFIVKINDDDTTQVTNIGTNQGVWNYTEKSKDPSMIVSDIKNANLGSEPDPDKSGKLHKVRAPKKKNKKNNKKRKTRRRTTKKRHTKRRVVKKRRTVKESHTKRRIVKKRRAKRRVVKRAKHKAIRRRYRR